MQSSKDVTKRPGAGRVVVPELLDSLPADTPDAIASRRDLRRINAVMGNLRWMQRQIISRAGESGSILELGAGDGSLAERVCAACPGLTERYHALDLAPRPDRFPAAATWHRMDLWSAEAAHLLRSASLVAANLMLHHFEDADLARLGSLFHAGQVIVLCEPCRRERFVKLARLSFPFINHVTRHDMVVSIRAGFRRGEPGRLLGNGLADRVAFETETCLGAIRTVFAPPL